YPERTPLVAAGDQERQLAFGRSVFSRGVLRFGASQFTKPHAVRAACGHVASAAVRNRDTRALNDPAGSRPPRSHLASVPWSPPSCPANTFCYSPSRVRQRTACSPMPLGGGGCGL